MTGITTMKNYRDDSPMLSCDDTRSLVPGYLDGELSEEQAAPLRAHLFECPDCRETAKQGKVLRRWFEPGPVRVTVPEGFAARVARRALAGDRGLPVAGEPDGLVPHRSGRGALLPFLLTISAVAAALLFTLAIALQRQTLPAENGLDALSPPDWARFQSAPATPDRGPALPDEPEEGEEGEPGAGR